MKDMYLNLGKMMGDWNYPTKKMGGNNILGSSMLSNVASAPNITGLSFNQAMGIKIKMGGGPSQKQYLRGVKRKPVADRMISYFTDSDGDLVVNALDCFSMDSRRHGVFSKTVNLLRGGGYRESEDLSQKERGQLQLQLQSQRPEPEPEQLTQAERVEVGRARGWQERIERERKQEPEETYEQMEQRQRAMKEAATAEYKVQVDEADESIDNYEGYKKSSEFKSGSSLDSELFRKMQKEIGEEKVAKEQLQEASQWHGERSKKSYDEFMDRLEKSKARAERLKGEESVQPSTLWGTVKQNIKRKVEGKVKGVHGRFAGMTGYVFEKRGVKKAMKEREVEKLRRRGEKAGIDPKTLQDLEERRRGYKEELTQRKVKGKFTGGYEIKKTELSPIERISTGAFKGLVGSKMKRLEKDKAIKEKKEQIEDIQLRREGLYQKSLMGLSRLSALKFKSELSRLPLEQRKARAVAELDIARAEAGKRQVQHLYGGQTGLGGFMVGGRQPEEQPFTRFPERPFISQSGFFNIGEQPKGRYDPQAPKFIYRKSATSFTRKSTRMKKMGVEPLYGDVIQPSSAKRKGSVFPWTKPMKGFERVYVGKGRFVKKGRRKKAKPKYDMKLKTKPPKRGFSPYFSTYKKVL